MNGVKNNMKKLLSKNIFLIFTLIMVFLPHSVFASTVYIDSDHSDFYVGDNIIFYIRVDSENKNINAVEGNISLNYSPESFSVNNLSLSESDFSLWPHKPSLSDDLKIISFAGGIPKGLNSTNAILFKIVLNFKQTGQVMLTPSDVAVYLNNGKGTKDITDGKSMIINILPQKPNSQPVDDWNNHVLKDETPPEPFEIFIGQEGSVFDGEKFLSFNAIDKQSGISYYEVIEGNLPPARSGSTYILKEHNKLIKVTVIAYDTAGNARESEYNPKSSYLNLAVIIPFILLLFVVFLVFKKKKNDFVQK